MPKPLAPVLILLLGTILLVPPAQARLEPKEWKQVQTDAAETFGQSGLREKKKGLIDQLLADGEKRSWKILTDAFVKEAECWLRIEKKIRDRERVIEGIQGKPMAKRTQGEQDQLRSEQEQLKKLEVRAAEQRGAYDDITDAVVGGPAELRKDLLKLMKGASEDWPARAAAARVAAETFSEEASYEHLLRVLGKEPDARVRMSGLEALRHVLAKLDAEEKLDAKEEERLEKIEAMVIGRLGDPEWSVQLLAVQVVGVRKMARAVPHLINALDRTSPRVAETIGEVLQEMTGQNFDPYADVWSRWWEDNKESFEEQVKVKAGKRKREFSDVTFYGLPVKSDRILFIIDMSKSMLEVTKNENPAEKWRKRGPVTGKEGDPPPPPPEEILSGPKVDVAKHELKKALKKLPPTAMFNIIAFNSAVWTWKDEMTRAKPKNVEHALKWVRALQPKGSTYIDGALRVGFRMAGLGAVDDKYPDVNVDTIVLLSDGAPTDDGWPKPELMEPEVILEHVRKWNRHKRVVIHTIGVDMQPWIVFLKNLADENGGTYIDR